GRTEELWHSRVGTGVPAIEPAYHLYVRGGHLIDDFPAGCSGPWIAGGSDTQQMDIHAIHIHGHGPTDVRVGNRDGREGVQIAADELNRRLSRAGTEDIDIVQHGRDAKSP